MALENGHCLADIFFSFFTSLLGPPDLSLKKQCKCCFFPGPSTGAGGGFSSYKLTGGSQLQTGSGMEEIVGLACWLIETPLPCVQCRTTRTANSSQCGSFCNFDCSAWDSAWGRGGNVSDKFGVHSAVDMNANSDRLLLRWETLAWCRWESDRIAGCGHFFDRYRARPGGHHFTGQQSSVWHPPCQGISRVLVYRQWSCIEFEIQPLERQRCVVLDLLGPTAANLRCIWYPD